MRKQHSNVEVIEVFAPDDIALWTDAERPVTAPTNPPPPLEQSSRGFVLAIFVAVFAVIVGAVALSDDTASESAPTTTTPPVPTTVRALLTPEPAVSTTAHYLVDDPALSPYSADIVTPAADGELFLGWTTASITGPMVSVQLHNHPYQPYGIVGATRRVVAGLELVTPLGRDTTAIVEVAIDAERSATVETSGLIDADVVQVATTLVVLSNGEIAFDAEVMERLGLTLSVKSRSLDQLLFGIVESTVMYLLPDGQTVTLRSAPTGGTQDGLLMRYASNVNAPFLSRLAGTLNDGGESFVVWRNGEGLLSLVGAVDQTVLVELSKSVRRATDDEWSAMLYGLRPDYTLGDFETLATGRATNTDQWAAGPQIVERAGGTEFLWWWSVPGLTNVTDSTAASLRVLKWSHVDTLVVPGATFVFVSHPNSGGTVTVRTATGVEYTAELEQPFPRQSPVFMTVIRVEEPGPVTVDRDGIAIGPSGIVADQ